VPFRSAWAARRIDPAVQFGVKAVGPTVPPAQAAGRFRCPNFEEHWLPASLAVTPFPDARIGNCPDRTQKRCTPAVGLPGFVEAGDGGNSSGWSAPGVGSRGSTVRDQAGRTPRSSSVPPARPRSRSVVETGRARQADPHPRSPARRRGRRGREPGMPDSFHRGRQANGATGLAT